MTDTQADGLQEGKVKWFNDAKGYGFIVADDGVDVFVHFRGQDGRFKSLRDAQHVAYEPTETPKGRAALTAQVIG